MLIGPSRRRPDLERVRAIKKALQFKLHKPMDAVDAHDLMQVCSGWGFDVETPVLPPPPSQEN